MQNHFDELSKRVTSVIILVIICTVIWSFSIDVILNHVLVKLDPCSESCINIFSPDEWAGTRWFSAALLGLFTAAPYAMLQAYEFAKPGLLPTERKGLIIWMIIVWILAFGSLVFSVNQFLPWLYSQGHSFNKDTGLVGKYDAAEMLRVSISIAWALILILASMCVVTIAGSSKLLWSGNANWWRLRIHGTMLMLLWLVIPSGLPGLLFALTIIASGLVELIGWKSFRSPMPIAYGLKELLDLEGRVHRVLYVNCSCCGTSPTTIQPLHGMGQVNYSSICRTSSQQDNLLDTVKRFGATKTVFSGCLIDSLPVDFIDSLRFLGCSAISLNLAQIVTTRTDGQLVDCNLAMACQVVPWSESNVLDRCSKILTESEISTVFYGEKIPFGLNLQPSEVWITNPTDSLIDIIRKLDIDLKYIGN